MPSTPVQPSPGEGQPTVELSIIIPAYNEERRLPRSFKRLMEYLAADGRCSEVILIDDGSKDQTLAIAKSLAEGESERFRVLEQPANRGKGAAVQRGVLASRGKKVLIIDADLSTPMTELPNLESRHQSGAVTIGSRAEAAAEITKSQPWFRVLVGRIFNVLAQSMAVKGISDTQCGFKLMDGEDARHLLSQTITKGFAYDVELLWLARKQQLDITEVGVVWHDDHRSTVRPWIDGPKMFLEILRFRVHHWWHRAPNIRSSSSVEKGSVDKGSVDKGSVDRGSEDKDESLIGLSAGKASDPKH